MDPGQKAVFLEHVAGLAPDERVAFAEARRIPPAALRQIEAEAEAAGFELAGGSVFETVPGGPGGPGGGDDDGGDGDVSVVDVWAAARDKAWAIGAALAFLGAPLVVLAVIRGRRGLSWRELLASAARLPFSD